MPMAVVIRSVDPGDRSGWEPLWAGYLDFYETQLADEVTAATWRRITGGDDAMGCLVAEDDGDLVGFAHYVLHPTTWTVTSACYLEDLFVAPHLRGGGIGRSLIEALAQRGRDAGWSGIHWLTAHDNHVGMRLYDRVATRTQWVRYELDL
jgi:GNAT superfamily N-acetyltransferase